MFPGGGSYLGLKPQNTEKEEKSIRYDIKMVYLREGQVHHTESFGGNDLTGREKSQQK